MFLEHIWDIFEQAKDITEAAGDAETAYNLVEALITAKTGGAALMVKIAVVIAKHVLKDKLIECTVGKAASDVRAQIDSLRGEQYIHDEIVLGALNNINTLKAGLVDVRISLAELNVQRKAKEDELSSWRHTYVCDGYKLAL